MPKAKASKKSSAPISSLKETAPSLSQITATGLPHLAPTYGLKAREKYLPFSHAETRLAKSRSYWICTARPDGRPHSIPVWGFWIDGALYFGTARDSRKSRNLSHNPAISIHLESGDDVVILEGTATEVDPNDKSTFKKLDAVSRVKYKMPMAAPPGSDSVVYRVRPRVVLAWTEKDFPNNATRWQLEAGGN
jgi:nitroimidazol reductase NimA-like FMN-containing flavoprotein (pyridoxamine 5'-phosphate oxidase superfamily)